MTKEELRLALEENCSLQGRWFHREIKLTPVKIGRQYYSAGNMIIMFKLCEYTVVIKSYSLACEGRDIIKYSELSHVQTFNDFINYIFSRKDGEK